MTVDNLIEELLKAKEVGCGNKQVKLKIPCVCVTDDNDIVENEHRSGTKTLSIKAEDIVKSGKTFFIQGGWKECTYDEYVEQEMKEYD